jgi:4-amino-4-deoxy-L-arabinose transferase-like glycosyltransferase
VALVLLGLAVRLPGLGDKVVWNDEVWTLMWLSGHGEREMTAALAEGGARSGAELLDFQRVTPGHSPLWTVALVARDDPKQPALYMILARLWAGAVGDSPGRVRLLSVLLSLGAIPAAAWLARLLWPRTAGAPLVAAALVALSPFQVAHAQEARPYALWILLTLLSSGALVRLLERPDARRALLFAATGAAGLYAHTFHGFVLAGQALAAWWTLCARGTAGRIAIQPLLLGFAGAALVYLPWALTIATRPDRVADTTGWVTRLVGLPVLLQRWAVALSSTVADLGLAPDRLPAADGRPTAALLLLVPGVLVAGASLRWLLRAPNGSARSDRAPDVSADAVGTPRRLVGGLMVPVTAGLLLPDLLVGGAGFSSVRFLVPLLVGVTLAVAGWLATGLVQPDGRLEGARGLRLAAVFALALASDVAIARSPAWWTKYFNQATPAAADLVRAAPGAVIVTDAAGLDLRRALSLAHALGPDARFFLVPKEGFAAGGGLPGASDAPLFLCGVDAGLRARVERLGYRVEPTPAGGFFWRLRPTR